MPSQLVPHPVQHRLAEVGLERASAVGLELPDPLHCLEQGILDEIVRVGQLAGPDGQASACPAAERQPVPRDQAVERLGIAGAGSGEERHRRVHVRPRLRGRGGTCESVHEREITQGTLRPGS
jgi:hypothetical protein